MANLKQLKNQIKAVEKTRQITKAMYSISASKIKRSEEALDLFNDFENEFDDIFNVIKKQLVDLDIKKKKGKKDIYILISSDRGLAGSFHQQLFKQFSQAFEENIENKYVYTIGKKAYFFAKKKKYKMLNSVLVYNRDDIETIDFESLATAFEKLFSEENINKVCLFYQKSTSKTAYSPAEEKILPLDFHNLDDKSDTYLFDDSLENMFWNLMHIYIVTKINKAILNSKKCEHFARLMAMKNASDNAKKVIEKLNLKYNYKRQHMITSELIDVINGAKGSE